MKNSRTTKSKAITGMYNSWLSHVHLVNLDQEITQLECDYERTSHPLKRAVIAARITVLRNRHSKLMAATVKQASRGLPKTWR